MQPTKGPGMAKSEGALEYVSRVLRRRWLIFLAAVIAVPLVAFLISSSKEKLYTATATLLFESEENPAAPGTVKETNEALSKLGVVAEQAAEEMGKGTSAEEVLGAIGTEPGQGQANVVNIKATSPSPERAAQIANGYSRAYIAFRKQTDQAKIQKGIDLVEKTLTELSPEELEGKQGTDLQERLNELKVEQALQTGETQLVQPAGVPSTPSSPRTKRNVIIGVIIGLILGFVLAALMERIDRRVRNIEELEEIYGAPLIAKIARSSDIPSLGLKGILMSSEAEDFRILRTNLRYFNVDRELKSVLLASAEPGDGKTTVAQGLAAAMAEVGEDVLLLEADLRKESEFRGPNGLAVVGLSNVLSGTPVDSALLRVQLAEPASEEPRPLTVLPSGPVPPNPSELLESERMRHLMEDLEDRFKVVVIDSPALGVVSDALALAPYTSEILVIGGVRRTTYEGAQNFIKQLSLVGRKPAGIIATFTDPDRKRYSYYQRTGVAAKR